MVANETLSGRGAADEIAHRAGGRTRRCASSARRSTRKLKHWTRDEDEARRRRTSASTQMLAGLRREGLEAEGDIGDGDPVQAMEDALRLFPADEVIISTHPPGRSNWLERDVVQRARERFTLPVTPRGRGPDREQAERRREHGASPS